MKHVRRAGFLACLVGGTLWLVLATSRSDAAVTGAFGTGDITFHSTFFTDASITPSNSTGTVVFPGSLSHDALAPGGAEHSFMAMNWTFSSTDAHVSIPGPTSLADTTRLELIPSPPVPVHHAATMTASFDMFYTLDGAGLPTTTLPGQVYQVFSYISPLPGSLAAASFDAHWDYTDVDVSGFLGSQDIHYVAPIGLGVTNTVASLPLIIMVPAGHTTLEVSGYFKLSADSDDGTGGPPFPFDTLIGVIPEPSSFVLLGLGAIGFFVAARRRGRAAVQRP